jgi:hypothetical protein
MYLMVNYVFLVGVIYLIDYLVNRFWSPREYDHLLNLLCPALVLMTFADLGLI